MNEHFTIDKRFIYLIALVGLAAISRLIPHPPNVTPVAAMALFGGAAFADRRLAFLLPAVALLLSDLIIGFHSQMLIVYGCFAVTVGFGLYLRARPGFIALGVVTLGSSLLFFLATNFGVWLLDGLYAHTLNGLVSCYVAALPFFRNSLLGNAFYVVLLFGLSGLLSLRADSRLAPAG